MTRPIEVQEAIAEKIQSLRAVRAEFGADSFARVYPSFKALLQVVRIEAFNAQEALDEAAAPKPAPVVEGPATFDEIVGHLYVASSRLQQFGATEAQIRLIATLAVRDGLRLSEFSTSTLSKRDASAVIDSFKGR